MKRFIAGADREQSTLLPECLDDFIDESNPVRMIDAFVDVLDLGELGFDGLVPQATGRPCAGCWPSETAAHMSFSDVLVEPSDRKIGGHNLSACAGFALAFRN